MRRHNHCAGARSGRHNRLSAHRPIASVLLHVHRTERLPPRRNHPGYCLAHRNALYGLRFSKIAKLLIFHQDETEAGIVKEKEKLLRQHVYHKVWYSTVWQFFRIFPKRNNHISGPNGHAMVAEQNRKKVKGAYWI